MTRCGECGALHLSLDGLEFARTDLVPDGITVEAGMIVVWRVCICGGVLAELFDRETGRPIDPEQTPLAEGGLTLAAAAS